MTPLETLLYLINENENEATDSDADMICEEPAAKKKRPRLIAYEMTEEERQYFENIEEEEYGVIVTNTNVNNV